ncbi:hypothetical protein [Catelliglobosispora koreensis]|uniref:hypothetical protein n=1 Tax=Catelliglobosispora koreensis TaxID=129052 RepID=UPI00037C99CC|nr:hypothetical protein [Catelliglobosispora koreensis]
MAAKIIALDDLLDPLFAEYAHPLGVVVASASMPGGSIADETGQTSAGFGLRGALPGSRMRESIIVHRRLVVPNN